MDKIDVKTIIHVTLEAALFAALFVWFRKKTQALEEKILELEKVVARHESALQNIIAALTKNVEENKPSDGERRKSVQQHNQRNQHNQHRQTPTSSRKGKEKIRATRIEEVEDNPASRLSPSGRQSPSGQQEGYIEETEDEYLGEELSMINKERRKQNFQQSSSGRYSPSGQNRSGDDYSSDEEQEKKDD